VQLLLIASSDRQPGKRNASVYIVTDLINALPGNSSINTKRQQQKGNCVFCAVRAEQKHGAIESLLPGNAAVNMHPQQWETVFSVVFVQTSYLKNERRYEFSSEFSVEDSHGKFVVEKE
jgi:hypothetical protein